MSVSTLAEPTFPRAAIEAPRRVIMAWVGLAGREESSKKMDLAYRSGVASSSSTGTAAPRREQWLRPKASHVQWNSYHHDRHAGSCRPDPSPPQTHLSLVEGGIERRMMKAQQ